MATGFTYRHYILKDHLGSWTTITDAEGNVEQELSFDAWGNLRDADTWTGTGTEAPMFDRGYTGHEHITAFGLINMNGRCYDPLMSSFLSVDEYVQDPTSALGFNRYAYCAYNPLKYTDPTGWYSSYGNPNVAPSINPAGHTTYHCDDPAEALWGRSIHPCETGTSRRFWCTTSNFMEGNSNRVGHDYVVGKNGKISRSEDPNGKTYDRLFTQENWKEKLEDRCENDALIIRDTNILSALKSSEKDPYYNGIYVISSNKEEMFDLFLFMSNHTDVEWAIDGFKTANPNVNDYVVATSHSNNMVTSPVNLLRFNELDLIFDIHSHQGPNATKGASGFSDDGYFSHDMAMITNRKTRFKNAKIETFPQHFVYHSYSKNIYYYTPSNSSIYKGRIDKAKDIYTKIKL